MKKILIVGELTLGSTGSYIDNLASNIIDYSKDIIVHILPTSFSYKSTKAKVVGVKLPKLIVNKKFRGSNKLIFFFTILWIIKQYLFGNRYDTIQIHYLKLSYYKLINLFKLISNNIVGVFWGSDLFRQKKENYAKLHQICLKCNVINFSTEAMEEFYKKNISFLPEKIKISRCRFGLSNLSIIDSLRNRSKLSLIKCLGISEEYLSKKIITIGYNGKKEQQHLKVIESLKELSNKNDYLLFFPVTYGKNTMYIDEIKNKALESNFESVFFESYLTDEKVAALRLLSDIFIQVQTTDALSGSTQEHLYAGSFTIVGDWLPYKILKESGVVFNSVRSISEIIDIIELFNSECTDFKEKNIYAIGMLSSWQYTIKDWVML